MLNALRLTDGVPASLFAERTGYPLAHRAAARSTRRRARDCSSAIRTRLAPTELGRRFLNDLLELFLPADGAQRARAARRCVADAKPRESSDER